MEQPNTTAAGTPELELPPAPTATIPALPPATVTATRGRRRVKQGRVASSKMDKTIVVVSETRVPHRTYGKIVRKSNRFKAHDERNEANVGDTVRIVECRPMSKDKRWRLIEIVERAK